MSATQVTTFTDWVNAGGNLVAMRPDPQLAGLLGLTRQRGTLSDAYLKVDTSTSPGNGIVGETIQFHGTADRYTLTGRARWRPCTPMPPPRRPTRPSACGPWGPTAAQAAAFTYDLARSVVYTRQGNPAWNGQERDGISPIRSDDLYFGAKLGDVAAGLGRPDQGGDPQADEQQRLLVNLILEMNADRKPLPRFWYLPRGLEGRGHHDR